MKFYEEESRIPAEGGITLHAWLFRPQGEGPFPAVTVAHGFAGVKYQGLRAYAERFARSGFVVVVHDHRNFALSGGDVRGDIDPWQQIADWRRVISYLEALPYVDPSRIGLWGSSYAGGHALVLAATDRRIKAAVAQIPTISGYEQGRRRVSPEQLPALETRFDADERAQLTGAAPAMQALVSTNPTVPAAFRTQAMTDFLNRFTLPDAVEANDEITVRSARRARMYEPGLWVERIAPTPLLMVVGTHDDVTPTDLALEAYQRALEPKGLQMFDGGHFDAYVDGTFETTSGAATDWFRKYLA
ncbi:alpha/beta hydrolase [Streptomyces phaeofaciens JCM 4814]|uniref:Xaa-Pro dipeptidyl-peptidase-like domain-containing protein n=2 Tax=Streptomyces phaeofaciens TaxID=68254 RepID=A0A918HRB5_9ACTN|nr:hypothetical protein GCM10010226_89580 [Streptomyces phaeofaciens]